MKDHNALTCCLERLLCVPIMASCELSEWMNDGILSFYDSADHDYRRAVNAVNRKFMNLSFEEIESITELSNPVYYARHPNHYYSREKSLEVIEKLLYHQYKSEDEVSEFVNRVFDITEKRIEKKNTMLLKGPPNSGKTYFTMFVIAFYINVGHVANFVRGQNFPLNDCCHRRILFWNEPSICPSSYDTVKMLCGGDPCPAKKKYSEDITISRTPLFINTNSSAVFPKTPVWDTRIYTESWTTADFLKECTQYPNPIAFIDLIKKYC